MGIFCNDIFFANEIRQKVADPVHTPGNAIDPDTDLFFE